MPITLDMTNKRVEVSITKQNFHLETGILTLQISLGETYDFSGKVVTAMFLPTNVETAPLVVTEGVIDLPITAGLVSWGENRIQINIREGLTLEQSPVMLWYVAESMNATGIPSTDVDIVTYLIEQANLATAAAQAVVDSFEDDLGEGHLLQADLQQSIADGNLINDTLTLTTIPNAQSINSTLTDTTIPNANSINNTLTNTTIPNANAINTTLTNTTIPNAQQAEESLQEVIDNSQIGVLSELETNIKTTLVGAINEVSASLKDTKEQINNLDALKADQTDLEVERARIDNIIAQPPTVDNIETTDIRVGADGKTYTSAGEAVREQFNKIGESSILTWTDVQTIIRMGIAEEYFPIGSLFNVEHSILGVGADKTLTFVVLGYDQDIPTDENYSHTMAIGLVGVLDAKVYDSPEANYKILTQINNGTLGNITFGSTTYDFTATMDLKAGGMLRKANATAMFYYETATSSAVTITIAAGSNNASVASSLSTQQVASRQQYGSNRWKHSAVRQWLNATETAGQWFEQQNDYDVAPTYAGTVAGFLNGIDADFISVVGEVTKRTALDTVRDGGGYEDLAEKFFLMSKTEINGLNENNVIEGEQYSYYADNGNASDTALAYRIKKALSDGTTPTAWKLRTPSSSSERNVQEVTTTGEFANHAASSAYGISMACVIW